MENNNTYHNLANNKLAVLTRILEIPGFTLMFLIQLIMCRKSSSALKFYQYFNMLYIYL